MDFQTAINLGASAVLAVVGWFVNGVRKDIREGQQALAAFQLKVAENYVTHTDLADIKAMLHRIEDKLDGKADKP